MAGVIGSEGLIDATSNASGAGVWAGAGIAERMSKLKIVRISI
jgi:hypothetical protein